jgi:hypothetical protein
MEIQSRDVVDLGWDKVLERSSLTAEQQAEAYATIEDDQELQGKIEKYASQNRSAGELRAYIATKCKLTPGDDDSLPEKRERSHSDTLQPRSRFDLIKFCESMWRCLPTFSFGTKNHI